MLSTGCRTPGRWMDGRKAKCFHSFSTARTAEAPLAKSRLDLAPDSNGNIL